MTRRWSQGSSSKLMGGSVWELPTQPQRGVIIASDLEPALLNQWTHIPPEGPPLPHSTAKHLGECSHSTSAAQVRPVHDHPDRMFVSVLEAGFLWRVRVLQGPATRHETITSVLSVVQVRSAILWLLRQRLLQCPSHKSRPLALVYLLTHPPARGSGAEDQQAGDHSGQH